MKKQNINQAIDTLLKDIEQTKRKDKQYILYTDLQKLKEIQAVLIYRDPEAIEAEITFHEQTKRTILEQFADEKMSNLIEAIVFKPKVTDLFHREQRIIMDLQRQLSFHKEYTVGEEDTK